MRRPKPLTESDLAEWAGYLRHVAPLPGRRRPTLPELPAAIAPASSPGPSADTARALPAAALARPAVPLHPFIVIGTQPPGVDNATWGRFRTGKLAPARTLDLHGHTAQRAYRTLEFTLRAAQADHLRCIEVITGRGAGETGGILRRELPLWLNLPQLRPLVLAACHPHPTNPGATRVLLRRAR